MEKVIASVTVFDDPRLVAAAAGFKARMMKPVIYYGLHEQELFPCGCLRYLVGHPGEKLCGQVAAGYWGKYLLVDPVSGDVRQISAQ